MRRIHCLQKKDNKEKTYLIFGRHGRLRRILPRLAISTGRLLCFQSPTRTVWWPISAKVEKISKVSKQRSHSTRAAGIPLLHVSPGRHSFTNIHQRSKIVRGGGVRMAMWHASGNIMDSGTSPWKFGGLVLRCGPRGGAIAKRTTVTHSGHALRGV